MASVWKNKTLPNEDNKRVGFTIRMEMHHFFLEWKISGETGKWPAGTDI
jgi:hypothetical protein